MITLPEPPQLVQPTTAVRTSYLVGEQADCIHRTTDTDWLGAASEDFDSFVADRSGVVVRWGVPSTIFWFVSGEFYIGTLVLRHELTAELERVGGHIGYHVVQPWHRQGHATAMLSQSLGHAQALGLNRVLLTCRHDNTASAKVIRSAGGIFDGRTDGEDRYWIELR